jgi:hypothetical protein
MGARGRLKAVAKLRNTMKPKVQGAGQAKGQRLCIRRGERRQCRCLASQAQDRFGQSKE